MLIRKIAVALLALTAFIACEKEKTDKPKEKTFDLTGFLQVYSGEKINLTIKEGANYEIKAKGHASDIDKLELKLTDNGETLDIAFKQASSGGKVDVSIIMPHLETAFLSGDIIAEISGYEAQVGVVGLVLSGKAKATVQDGAPVIAIDVTGNAKLELNGHTASLAGEVSANGEVKGYGLTANNVYLETSQQSKAWVRPINVFYGSAANDSKIFYKGDPPNKELLTSENGEIIQE